MKYFDWFNRAKASPKLSDDTRPLRRGEIKKILVEKMGEAIPDFVFLDYRKTFYTFTRTRRFGSYNLHELLHIGFSLKGGAFSCSVASRINPDLIHNNWYNTGPLNPHFDLIQLKKGTGIIRADEAYYVHNGMFETCNRVVEQILADIKEYGLPFLNKQFFRLKNNETIQAGLQYIERLDVKAADELKRTVESELKAGRGHISAVKHPIYLDLKRTLQAVPGESRNFRKSLPNAALELLKLFWAVNREKFPE